MSAVQQNFIQGDRLLSVGRQSNMTENANLDNIGLDKKISRVLRLRDMFQTGVIRPIEEIDDPVTPPKPDIDKHVTDERLRFLRTLPGSPPLSTLRAHQTNRAKVQQTETKTSSNDSILTNGSGLSLHRPSSLASNSASSSPIPPTTPPKPNYQLPLDGWTKRSSKVSTELQKSIAIFENAQSNQPASQNGPAKPVRSSAKPPVQINGSLESRKYMLQQNLHADTTNLPPQTQQRRTSLSPQAQQESTNISRSRGQTVTEMVSHATVTPSRDRVSQSSPTALGIPEMGVPCSGSTPKPSPVSAADTDQMETEYESVESYRPDRPVITPGRLSSWKGTADLDRVSSPTTEAGNYQDFIVQSDAFRTSPNYLLEPAQSDQTIPELQHAEQVAVTTADDDEEAADLMERPSCPAPCLPVPASLKVVAVDSDGVHILEDGNFVYAVPGLPNRRESASSDECNVVLPRSRNSLNDAVDIPVHHSSDLSESLLPNSSRDSTDKRVRFSTDPILIFSTYSYSEYDRRNDDIDPLAASAEYELEKHLEEMDLFNVNLKKSAHGLGISILGLGVDNVGGEQKLGIFIKGLTPGGAAEANGKIMVYDQIVEVDGVSLVGVSQQFAAQTLRNTKEVVHFILAREKDPQNSRIAQLLAEQEEDEKPVTERSTNPLAKSSTQDDASKDQSKPIPPDDSMDALRSVINEAENLAAALPGTPVSEDEVTDLSGVGQNAILQETEGSVDQAGQTLDSYSPPPTELDRSGSSDSPGFRSALKGTATAASTKRRQDALLQIIHSAEERVSAEADSRLPPLIPGVNKVSWALANDLYDCHAQLLKTQTQLQTLEQRLATQEAAAEEAIERLCLQCRHMELKFSDANANLQLYVEAHRDGRLIFTDLELDAQLSPNGIPLSVGGDGRKSPKGGAFALSPSTLPTNLERNDSEMIVHSQPELVEHGSVESDANLQNAPRASSVDAATSVSTWSEKQIQDRARLVSSGGLSNRRPRTRVVINPPPTLMSGPPVSSAADITPSSSDVTYIQSVTQHLLFPVPTEKSVSRDNPPEPTQDKTGVADQDTSENKTAADQSRTIPMNTDQSSPVTTATSASPRAPAHKTLGIQLPGLSPGMLQSINLRRRSPTPDQTGNSETGSNS